MLASALAIGNRLMYSSVVNQAQPRVAVLMQALKHNTPSPYLLVACLPISSAEATLQHAHVTGYTYLVR